MSKRLIYVHLYNDFSGSPKVLSNVIKRSLEKSSKNEVVEIITSNTEGALSELKQLPNVKFHTYSYSFSTNKIVTFCRYCRVQIYTFFFAFKYLFSKDTAFYINTILPVAPALAAKIMGKKVIYHYHENAFIKSSFYRFLCRCMEALASEIICVSKYQASFLKRQNNVRVVYNSLSDSFLSNLHPDVEVAFSRKIVLMIASLKEYKGVVEFVQIASALTSYCFVLVINDTQNNIDKFFIDRKVTIPQNLSIYPRQDSVTHFYNEASLLVNLSDKNRFIETFGMTVLEAMSAALPVIVPTVGGVAELVDDGVNGYKIDVQHLDEIIKKISEIFESQTLYSQLAENALKASEKINSSKKSTSGYGAKHP